MSTAYAGAASHIFSYAEELVLAGSLRRALAAGALCSPCTRRASLRGIPMHLSFIGLCRPCVPVAASFCSDIVVDIDAIMNQSRAWVIPSADEPLIRCYSIYAQIVHELKTILLHPFETTDCKIEHIRSRNYVVPSTLCVFIGTPSVMELHMQSCAYARRFRASMKRPFSDIWMRCRLVASLDLCVPVVLHLIQYLIFTVNASIFDVTLDLFL
jgi:type IV secretory pathway VirB3-like protein